MFSVINATVTAETAHDDSERGAIHRMFLKQPTQKMLVKLPKKDSQYVEIKYSTLQPPL